MIKIAFKYSLFIIAFILVSATFITAVSFTHLGVAMIIYLLFALFVYKAFPHFWGSYTKKSEVFRLPSEQDEPEEKTQRITKEETAITDINKRAFLKLIGATSILFFLGSIFNRRIENLVFGQNPKEFSTSNGKTNVVTTSPTDEYKISGIDYDADGYFGYIKKDGSWYIMKGDPGTKSFLYVKGTSKFPENWDNRQNLRYDYFHKVFKA